MKGAFQDEAGTVVDTDWTYAVGQEGLHRENSRRSGCRRIKTAGSEAAPFRFLIMTGNKGAGSNAASSPFLFLSYRIEIVIMFSTYERGDQHEKPPVSGGGPPPV